MSELLRLLSRSIGCPLAFALGLLVSPWPQALMAAPTPVPAAPSLSAKSYLLLDFHSGQTLAEANADEKSEPASLTKLMTAYVVFRELAAGHIALTDQATISKKAWRTPGSRMFVEVGKKVSLEDLLKGMIIQSGNDASVAIAELVAGSEDTFAEMMNHEAKRLGMKNTHFTNSTGLPDKALYTTARDLAILTHHLIREFPEHYSWYSVRKFTYNDITQYNRNKLLWRDASVDGVKTGYTESAGYCLITSAKRSGMRLIAVVLGTESVEMRTKGNQALLSYGFRFFETHRLYAAGEPLTQTRIWKGATDVLPLGLAQALYVSIPREQYDKLQAEMNLDATILAPATKGQAFGTVNVRLEDRLLAEKPLIALKDVPEGSLWQRLMGEARLWFE